MISDRRSFFGKVFGGVLVALGVKAAPLLLTVTDRPEVFSAGWIDTLGNRHDYQDRSDYELITPTLLKRGDVLILGSK